MELKRFAFTELKADDTARTVEGFASVFGNVDSYDDIVMPGAFTKSLQARLPAMLWQHDSDQIPGLWTEATESATGLYVKGPILDTTLGNDVYKLAKAGAVTGMSIGYSPVKYSIDQDTGIRRLTEIDLWEVSLVTFPANDMARVTAVKAKPETERDLERYLRDAGFSRGEAKKIVADGYKALGQRDADEEAARLITLFNQFTA
jgi:HK97 family phage prohead protease